MNLNVPVRNHFCFILYFALHFALYAYFCESVCKLALWNGFVCILVRVFECWHCGLESHASLRKGSADLRNTYYKVFLKQPLLKGVP